MNDETGRELLAVDEILQVMFWLEGEGLASSFAVETIGRFLPFDAGTIERLLDALVNRGWVRASAARSYVFTGEGRQEAARRFADEFADMTKPGHGECADPDCECHRTGSPAQCRYNEAG